MVAFRFISWFLVAVALMLLGADAISSLETGAVEMRSVAEVLSLFGLNAPALIAAAPGGVSQALAAVLGVPLWAVFGVIGVILVLVFRPMD